MKIRIRILEFRILSISTKRPAQILIWTTFNLSISLRSTTFFIILSLRIMNMNVFPFIQVFFNFSTFLIEVQLSHNIVSISALQQSDSIVLINMYFLIFFFIMIYHRILNIGLCAIEWVFVGYLKIKTASFWPRFFVVLQGSNREVDYTSHLEFLECLKRERCIFSLFLVLLLTKMSM